MFCINLGCCCGDDIEESYNHWRKGKNSGRDNGMKNKTNLEWVKKLNEKKWISKGRKEEWKDSMNEWMND